MPETEDGGFIIDDSTLEVDWEKDTEESLKDEAVRLKMANILMVIVPYWCQGTWVFDDESVGLNKEPFVAGVPEMIDNLVKDIPNARGGFRLLFSSTPFPGYQIEITRVKEEYHGYWYRVEDQSTEGCCALPYSSTLKLHQRRSILRQNSYDSI